MDNLDNFSLLAFVVLLLVIGQLLYSFARIIRHMWRNHEFRTLLIAVAITIGSGMVFYHRVEQWSWLDSLYFTIITLTTVGYGDFSPATPVGKIFTIIYILLGLGLLAAFITTIANIAIEYSQERRNKQ